MSETGKAKLNLGLRQLIMAAKIMEQWIYQISARDKLTVCDVMNLPYDYMDDSPCPYMVILWRH